MLTAKVVKKGNQTEKLLQSLRNLKKEYISVGHFAEQGQHYSGMSYPQLMNLWARGGPDPANPRIKNPREVLRNNITAVVNTPTLEVAFNSWITTADTDGSPDKLLDSFGVHIKTYYKNLFGKVGPLMAPDLARTPLVETHDLEDHIGYKTSKNRAIKT